MSPALEAALAKLVELYDHLEARNAEQYEVKPEHDARAPARKGDTPESMERFLKRRGFL